MNYTKDYWNSIDKVINNIPNLSSLNGKSVFITGATGLIGSAITELLLRYSKVNDVGIKVIAAVRTEKEVIDRFGEYYDQENLSFFKYDSTVSDTINIHADYCIHCASNAHPAAYVEEPVETMLGNIIGLNNILDSAKNSGVKRVLYFSSSEVYGEKNNDKPYTENDFGYVDFLNPRSCYPSSKRASETLCVAYAKEYGIDTVIVRPGHIYGPTCGAWDTRAAAQFARAAANGENIVMKSPGLQLRSYMHTLDCASAVLTVLINGEKENAYNISNPDSIVTVKEMAEAMARAGDVEVIYDVATEEEKKGYNMMSNSALDSKKLESLGWKGTFSMEDGAKHTIEMLRQFKM